VELSAFAATNEAYTMGHYTNVLPSALGAIRADLEDDTATEYRLVQDAAAQAEHGRRLYRMWHTIAADGTVDARERRLFGSALAAHVQGDAAHVDGDLLSLNNNRAINGRFTDLYSTESVHTGAASHHPSPLTLGEVLA